jgi:hypothetical protein
MRATSRALAALPVLCLLACGSSSSNTPPVDPPDADVDAAVVDPAIYACGVAAPTSCPSPAPTYADIAPIVQRLCIPCHIGAADGPWPLTAYQHVADWQDIIRAAMLDCTMPPDAGFPMTRTERLTVLTWIRCGLPR